MTEKEKRDKQMIYNANHDKSLMEELFMCKELCFQFNQLSPLQFKEKEELARKILGKTPEKFYIQGPMWCDYIANTDIGDNFYANHNLMLTNAAKITFGNNVFVGPDCGFYTAAHPIDSERRNIGLEWAYPITVGDNVWFGGACRVMPGVKIGSNVVIGAASVVTKDIPDNVVAVGNPCRVLRPITDADKEVFSSENKS